MIYRLQHLVPVTEEAARAFSANISAAAKQCVNETFFGPREIFLCVFKFRACQEKRAGFAVNMHSAVIRLCHAGPRSLTSNITSRRNLYCMKQCGTWEQRACCITLQEGCAARMHSQECVFLHVCHVRAFLFIRYKTKKKSH